MADPSLDTQYDVLYILRTELSQDEQDEAVEAFKDVVIANGGTVEAVSPWGVRRFAYEIDGLREGVYVNMLILGKACIQELDRRLRIDSRTVRHMIVRETRRQYKARLKQAAEPLVVPEVEEPEVAPEDEPEAAAETEYEAAAETEYEAVVEEDVEGAEAATGPELDEADAAPEDEDETE